MEKKLQNEIDELEQMKLRWYRPVHSPNMDGMPHSTTPGDPTAQAVHRIDMINDKITGIQQQLADIVEEILNWLYERYEEVPEGTTLPAKYDQVQIFAVIAGFSVAGAEGESRHIENGIHRYFKYPDMLAYIKSNVSPYVRVPE